MNPTASDLHINRPLEGVSIAYKQSSDSFIADRVFPKVPVAKKSDIYWKYSKSDWRRTNVRKRAPGTEAAGVGWNNDTDTYYCEVFSVKKDIDDQTRANADSNFNLDRDTTEFLTMQHLLQRDLDWAAAYFGQGIWATNYTGVDTAPAAGEFEQWDQASSDPIRDVMTYAINFRRLTGFAFNICVMGAYVMAALKQHPDIIDRIKYTQRGVVTEDLIATLFDVDELYVSYATVADGPQIDDARTQDAQATYDFIGDPVSVLFCYAPKSPGLQTPSAGYVFVWTGYQNTEGIKVKKFRMENIESDRVEASMTYDMKVVCADMGLFLFQAVATPA